MAKERVAKRVSMGGHNIPAETVERRYFAGIRNLIGLYIPVCDNWMVINSLGSHPELIASGTMLGEISVKNADIWRIILMQSSHVQ